jgi:DDE superfamily endonuclease
MVMVTTTGYIITIFGPFLSDFHNNDASILKHVMLNNYEDILNWIKEGDIMILDRGFRDSLGVLKSLGIDAAMPSFLSQSERQFDVYDANRSRFVTKIRWVVESVNVRLKRFKWFSQTIQNTSAPSIPDFLAIVAALNNCFHVPLVKSTSDDDELVRQMNFLLTRQNTLQQWLMENDLFRRGVWQTKCISDLQERFPVLSLDYIRWLTMGTQSLSLSIQHIFPFILRCLPT